MIAKSPNNPKGHEGLATTHIARQKLDKAVEVYKNYLKSHPHDEDINQRLADLYLVQESYDKAIDQYKALSAQTPEDMNIHYKLGLTYLRQADMTGDVDAYNKALSEFQMIRAKDPSNPRVAVYIATIFERLKLYEEAVEIWKTTGGEDPQRDVLLKIAELY